MVVTRRVRLLEPRCQEGELPQRLHRAVEKWKNNGGKLTRDVLPAAGDSGNTAPEDRAIVASDNEAEPSALPFHRVLDSGFRLRAKAFMLTYNSDAFTKKTWEDFRQHMRCLRRALNARAWAANWEESLEAQARAPRFHGHGYLFWTDGLGVNRRNTDDLVFRSVRPRVDVCVSTNPKNFKMSACRGLWYVSVMKKGTWRTSTNFPPWRQYTPKAAWLSDLWSAHKVTDEQYRNLSRQFGQGHSDRKRDALDALRDAREEAVHAHVLQELTLLRRQGKFRQAKSFREVDTFVDFFRGEAKFRKPILAIIGGTNLGKSMLAAQVLLKVARVLGLRNAEIGEDDGGNDEPFLEVTVEDSLELDMRDFNLCVHAGVLLDGVADTKFLKKHREVLQGRPKICKGGKSGTMIYSYAFSLCRRAVVATFDLSAANLKLLATDHWLSDSRNVLQLHLEEAAWETGSPRAQEPPLSRREKMLSWTVDELADFLESEDLRGPAQTLQSAGVNGADFLCWNNASELQADLRTTPFTARTLLATRDLFLNGAN